MALLVSALVLASVYTLIAIGWVVIFRATEVPNFATGNLILIGVLVFFTFVGDHGLPIFVGLLVTFVLVGAFFALVQRTLLKPLMGEPLWSPVMLTFGLAILLNAIGAIIWGSESRVLPHPIENKNYQLPGDANITTYGIISIFVATLVIVGLLAFFRWSRIGTQMRAVAESPVLASQSGIRVNVITMIAWAIAACTATLAGIQYGYTNVVSQDVVVLGLRGLAPALIGGFDSVKGCAVGAVIVALAESYSIKYLGGQSQDAAAFVVLLVFLVIRPYGLFGTPAIRRV